MAEINITTVRDMIDSSFYDEDTNAVNFKMIQNVLFILARQLQILQRHVSIEYSKRLNIRESEVKISEIKVHSKLQKHEKERHGSLRDREGKQSSGSPESTESQRQGAHGGPNDHHAKKDPGKHVGKTGQGVQGGLAGHASQGSKGGQGGKGVQGGNREQGSHRGVGAPESKGSQGAKGPHGSHQAHGGQDDHGAKGQQGHLESEERQDSHTLDGKESEAKIIQAKDAKTFEKAPAKSSKEKITDTLATYDPTASTAASEKSQGKTDDRKRRKKGDSDGMDLLHEKLLVVSRTSSNDSGRGTVATQNQFLDMVAQIRELQTIFGIEDSLDDAVLRGALHTETSLSNPVAAVNMSSRLEAAEKKLAVIMPIVMDLAKQTPGIDMEAAFDDIFLKPPISSPSKTAEAEIQSDKKGSPPTDIGTKQESDEEPEHLFLLDPSVKGVTHDELTEGLDEIYNAVMKIIKEASMSNYKAADGALKRTHRMDERLDQAMKLGDTLTKLDTSVEDYTNKINDLDSKLTAQTTNYQDELMHMQHSLETGLDAMAEVLAAPKEDAAAIAELNGYFTCFQLDIDRTLERQQNLRKLQLEYAENLDELKKKIKELQVRKCTRDEVTDALSDKAGIADLNGLVTMEQYQAVRGDFEKRIAHAYNKFNNKEMAWQKSIDDLVRELNEKTDFYQLAYLNKEVQKNLMLMGEDLDEMLDLVGDIGPVTTTRKVDRHENCLSCGTRFDVGTGQDHLESRPPVISTETTATKKDLTEKYHGKCYPGYPITHPIDPRSLICHRYCGSTELGHRESAFKMQISELNPNQATTIETIGKVHATDESKKPCLPCNKSVYRTPCSITDSIRFNKLVSGPIDSSIDGETEADEKGILE